MADEPFCSALPQQHALQPLLQTEHPHDYKTDTNENNYRFKGTQQEWTHTQVAIHQPINTLRVGKNAHPQRRFILTIKQLQQPFKQHIVHDGTSRHLQGVGNRIPLRQIHPFWLAFGSSGVSIDKEQGTCSTNMPSMAQNTRMRVRSTSLIPHLPQQSFTCIL